MNRLLPQSDCTSAVAYCRSSSSDSRRASCLWEGNMRSCSPSPRLASPTLLPKQTKRLDFDCLSFAMLYADQQGVLRMEASSSIANHRDAIFTGEVTERFRQNILSSPSAGAQRAPAKRDFDSLEQSRCPSPCKQGSMMDCLQHMRGNASKEADALTTSIPGQRQTGFNKRQKKNPPTQKPSNGRSLLPVGDSRLLRQYYHKAFEKFQQTNCRIIAKSFIKLVEPRKQVNYPYNGRRASSIPSRRADPETTKPKWWPTGVIHKEPDHLPKTQRVRLLVHILCDLRESHGMTADKLRDASQEVRRLISPADNLHVLDEMFHVRSMEERYLSGELSADATVTVSRVHVTDARSVDVEEEVAGEPATSTPPAPVAAPSPAVTASLNASHASAGVGDNYQQTARHENNLLPQRVHGLALLHSPSMIASNDNDAYRMVVPPYATPALGQALSTSMQLPSPEKVRRSSLSGTSSTSFSSIILDTPSTVSPFSEAPTPSVGTPCSTSYFPPGAVYHPQGMYDTGSSSWIAPKQNPCSSQIDFGFGSVNQVDVDFAHRELFPQSYCLQH